MQWKWIKMGWKASNAMLSRYLKHCLAWYYKRWRLLLKQMMCQWSRPNSLQKLMDSYLVFLLVLVWWQPNVKLSLMQLTNCGKLKHLLVNQLGSSGAPGFMVAARNLQRKIISTLRFMICEYLMLHWACLDLCVLELVIWSQ